MAPEGGDKLAVTEMPLIPNLDSEPKATSHE